MMKMNLHQKMYPNRRMMLRFLKMFLLRKKTMFLPKRCLRFQKRMRSFPKMFLPNNLHRLDYICQTQMMLIRLRYLCSEQM